MAPGAIASYVGAAVRLDQSATGRHGPRRMPKRLPLPFPEIDPVAFAIGPFVVRWYALAYLAGVFLGAGYGMLLVKRTSLWAQERAAR